MIGQSLGGCEAIYYCRRPIGCLLGVERLEFGGENADIGDVGRVKTGLVK